MRSNLFAICWCGLALPVLADESVDYIRVIKPVLQVRCYACHGILKQEAGLRLDTAALALKGGTAGAVIKPGDVATSSLLRRVSSTDDAERMPPEGEPLKAEEIAALRNWIAAGAVAPVDETPERDPREHWAFQPPKRSQFAAVGWGVTTGDAGSGTCKNPIHSFIAATHWQHGLRPQRPADKRVWLRRVSRDLIGLPPSREELDAFLADDSADAFDTVVTELLESPH